MTAPSTFRYQLPKPARSDRIDHRDPMPVRVQVADARSSPTRCSSRACWRPCPSPSRLTSLPEERQQEHIQGPRRRRRGARIELDRQPPGGHGRKRQYIRVVRAGLRPPQDFAVELVVPSETIWAGREDAGVQVAPPSVNGLEIPDRIDLVSKPPTSARTTCSLVWAVSKTPEQNQVASTSGAAAAVYRIS